MIDEATLELLSRHLDGDLGAAERRLLEARLANEPSLAAELHGLERLRSSLRELASREVPPAELDAALEPLRRSQPPTLRLRPAHRWMALAATLLIGATVTFHVAQRSTSPPGPSTGPTRGAQETGDMPYQLRPLPTSAVPEEEELLGAADHFLASPLPTPVLPEPPVHTAVGPLTESERELTSPAIPGPPPGRRDARGVGTTAPFRPRDEEQAGAKRAEAGGEKKEAGVVTEKATIRQLADEAARRQPAPASAGRPESRSSVVAAREGTVTLRTETGPVVVHFSTRSVDGPTDRRALVAVRNGVITAVRSPTTNEAGALPGGLLGELTGLPAGDVADGEYAAAIRVN